QSTCDPCGNFLTWPADLEEFANALHLVRFTISGASGGAPYALAAARALANRVTNVALLCPMAPLEAVGAADSAGARVALLAHAPLSFARMALTQPLVFLRRNPNRIPGALVTLATADRDVLADPANRQQYVEGTFEAYRQGTDQLVHAAAQLADPWACWLKE